MKNRWKGHLLAAITIVIWSTTFISTKVLLRTFTPVEILILRFLLGYLSLTVLRPRPLKTEGWRQEVMYMLAGLTGVTLYYMLENTALIYTMASNAGVIISAAPFFTAVLAHLLHKGEDRFRWNFLAGFVIALAGIALISFNGAKLQLNPIGDLMMTGAALSWAFYCLILRRINTFGHPLLQSTKRIFFWGLVFFIPCLPFTGFSITLKEVLRPENIGNLLFLGVGACALCFIMWNEAVRRLGAVDANFYIYLTPVVTLVASAIFLNEPITPLLLLGTALTLGGLIISEWRNRKQASGKEA